MAAATASIIVPLFSPAGAADWATHFLAYATELDATGFPRSGSFGFGFHCYTDLSVAATAVSRRTAAEAAILETYTRLGQVLTPTELGSKVRQLCTAYEELYPGCIVAFKKGISVVAIARITSDYRYEPAHEGTTTAIHRWDYEILQKLPMKIPLPGRNATYYSNGYLYTPPAPAPAFNVPEDAEPPAPAPAPAFNVPEDAEPPAPRVDVPEDAVHRIAALEAENARLRDRLAAALALIHTLTATT